jgi:hypothetical protein
MKKLTEYHKTWLQENYGKVSREDCALRLKCSNRTIDRWVSELGLQTRKPKDPSKPSKKLNKVVEVKSAVEAQKGYCMDCEHYIVGGQCGKNGKPTGALNEKLCFKQNTL